MTTTTAKSIGKVHRKEFPKVYEYIKHGKTYYRIDYREVFFVYDPLS